jgi:UMF1 family MFS transporter
VPYLILLTVVAVLLTAALDVAGGVFVALAIFVAADLAYQSALVFYNALLPAVSVGRGLVGSAAMARAPGTSAPSWPSSP